MLDMLSPPAVGGVGGVSSSRSIHCSTFGRALNHTQLLRFAE